jgi:hypothetical protein
MSYSREDAHADLVANAEYEDEQTRPVTYLVVFHETAVRRSKPPSIRACERLSGTWRDGEVHEERWLTVPAHSAERAEEMLEQDPAVREFIAGLR